MSRILSLALLLLASGCVRAYRPPTLAEPHATLKLRRIHEKRAGTHLATTLAVDAHPAGHSRIGVELSAAPITSTLLLHPRATELALTSTFFHQELRLVRESYTVQVPYSATESYGCGSGSSYRTCMRSVTRYRSEIRYRDVTRLVDVPDGSCNGTTWINPRNDGIYLVEFTYRENGVCHVACYEQAPAKTEGGAFENRPCVAPTDQEKRVSLAKR